MENHRFYLSTIAADAAGTARQYALGLEIAEYCTACNMDEHFPETDAAVREKLAGIARVTLHAPFNELFPCAIDPRARELAADRFREAIALAKGYGAEKIVIHGGYNPQIYYPCWYTEQSALFWKDFLREDPGVDIVLENVLEEEPEYCPLGGSSAAGALPGHRPRERLFCRSGDRMAEAFRAVSPAFSSAQQRRLVRCPRAARRGQYTNEGIFAESACTLPGGDLYTRTAGGHGARRALAFR